MHGTCLVSTAQSWRSPAFDKSRYLPGVLLPGAWLHLLCPWGARVIVLRTSLPSPFEPGSNEVLQRTRPTISSTEPPTAAGVRHKPRPLDDRNCLRCCRLRLQFSRREGRGCGCSCICAPVPSDLRQKPTAKCPPFWPEMNRATCRSAIGPHLT